MVTHYGHTCDVNCQLTAYIPATNKIAVSKAGGQSEIWYDDYY